jgi:hypothetical protein
MRKTLLLLTTTSLALLLAAGVTLAQAPTQHINQTLPVDFDLDDTEGCSGELIHLTGELHAVFHLTLDDAGDIQHLATMFTFAKVKGTGLVSGEKYTVPTTATTTAHNYPGGFPITVTEQSTSNVIGQGQLPDSRVHFLSHITVNENETVTAEFSQFRAECSGGEPIGA